MIYCVLLQIVIKGNCRFVQFNLQIKQVEVIGMVRLNDVNNKSTHGGGYLDNHNKNHKGLKINSFCGFCFGEKGFTLVEIIGVIVLLTIIGLIIYPVINNLVVIETLDNTTNTSVDGIKSFSGYVQMVKLFIHSL